MNLNKLSCVEVDLIFEIVDLRSCKNSGKNTENPCQNFVGNENSFQNFVGNENPCQNFDENENPC